MRRPMDRFTLATIAGVAAAVVLGTVLGTSAALIAAHPGHDDYAEALERFESYSRAEAMTECRGATLYGPDWASYKLADNPDDLPLDLTEVDRLVTDACHLNGLPIVRAPTCWTEYKLNGRTRVRAALPGDRCDIGYREPWPTAENGWQTTLGER